MQDILNLIPLKYYAFTGLLNFITTLIISVWVILKNSQSKVNRTFSAFAFSIACWSIFYFLWLSTPDKTLAEFYLRTCMIPVLFMPPVFYQFIVYFLNIKYKKIYLPVNYILSIIFALTVYTPLYSHDPTRFFSIPYWMNAGPVFHLAISHFGIIIGYTWYLLFKKLQKSSGIFRSQLLYVFAGTLIGFIGGSTNYFGWYKIPFPPIFNILVSVYMGLIACAIIKYRLMDIRVMFTRAGIFLIVYSFVLGVPFWIGYHSKQWFVSTLVAVIFATIGPAIYRFIQKKTENLLLAQQRHYQKILLQAAREMVREHDLDKLLKLIVHVVKRVVKIEFAAVFIHDIKNDCYALEAARDHNKILKNFTFAHSHPLITLIKQTKKSLTYDDVKYLVKKSLGDSIHLIIPSSIEDNLLGFLVLGEKINRTVYTDDDIVVFETLARQAALAIEHCLFLQEFKQVQENLFQAEKLASIGGMASGVAHQMRNRLNLFAVAVGELQAELKNIRKKHPELIEQIPDLKDSLDYSFKAAESINNNVKRTAEIITGILNFTHVEAEATNFLRFSLKEIVELTILPLKTKHSIETFPLKVTVNFSDMIYGIKSQLLEVVFNILDNGFEAIKEKTQYELNKDEKKKFIPLIEIELCQKEDISLIRITDNGMGIKEEDKNKIFAPFFTTKASYISGTGIGLYVVKRIIEENHKGKIWVESEYTKWTKFFIELPKKKEV